MVPVLTIYNNGIVIAQQQLTVVMVALEELAVLLEELAELAV
jgi:hypothetical protein